MYIQLGKSRGERCGCCGRPYQICLSWDDRVQIIPLGLATIHMGDPKDSERWYVFSICVTCDFAALMPNYEKMR